MYRSGGERRRPSAAWPLDATVSVRILHVCPYSDATFGGPVSTLLGLTSAQSRAGDVVTVATASHPSRSHSIIPQLESAGVRVVVTGPHRGTFTRVRDSGALLAAIADADIVHVHGIWENLVVHALRGSAAAGIPSVLRPCGMLTGWSLSRHALRKRLLWRARARNAVASASAIHFASEQERRETRVVPIGAQRVFVEPNGIDVTAYTGGDAARFRARFALPDGAPILLFIGRMHAGKGLDALIDAFVLVGGDVVLVIAGPSDRAYVKKLERAAEEHGVRDRVHFVGMIGASDRRDALAAAHVFILPSEHESFGNSALEALAAGVPSIVTDRVPLASFVAACDAGAVCGISAEQIGHEIRAMLNRIPPFNESAMAAARARASRCAAPFDWALVAARIGDEYRSIVDAERPHRMPGSVS